MLALGALRWLVLVLLVTAPGPDCPPSLAVAMAAVEPPPPAIGPPASVGSLAIGLPAVGYPAMEEKPPLLHGGHLRGLIAEEFCSLLSQ